MDGLNKLRRKLEKARKDLIKASLRKRKYLAIKPLEVSKPPESWNSQQMEKDYEAKDSAERKYRELLKRWFELTRKSKRKS